MGWSLKREHVPTRHAVVFAPGHATHGQRVVAAIEQKTGLRVDEMEIQAFCRERLARYKVPDTIKTVEALPRNAMNKIVKPRLRPLFDKG